MKKTISTIILSVLFVLTISGCQFFEDKWNKKDPGLTDSYYQTQEKLLNTAQEKLKNDPKDFTAQFEVAYRYHMAGKYKDAVAEYEKALAIGPNDFATLNNLAAIYEEVKEYSNAAKYTKKLYELNPDNVEVIRDTVRILLENGEPQEAQKALENFADIIKKQDKADQSDILMISELFQSIDTYNKQHAKK